MSIWKSPIFYFGLVLVAVVMAALAAPYIVNWNAYRDNLESYGRKLTGREVAINGSVSVRLFPWPRLVTEDVSIANPKGMEGAPTLNARSINVELALAGLFGGEIRVESITLEHPVISIVRNVDGSGNWNLTPDQALQNSKLLDQVKLESITIIDGEVQIRDNVHGYGTTVKAINAILSASVLEGPWRALGSAKAGKAPFDLNFSSSVWKAGEPFKFALKLSPQDGALPALAFEGQQILGEVAGKLNLLPVITDDGRQSLEGSFKPLQMQAEIKANFENLTLDKVHIVPADPKDSGTLIEGTASLALQNGVKAQVNLNSPRLDMDSLAGSQSLRIWRAGGAMAVLNSLIKDFPEKLDLVATLDVATLSAAGEKLENVKLSASAEQNAIRIQDFTANLPGRSRMKFGGIIFPGDLTAEMGGTLAFESNDTRQFAGWLWPEAKAAIANIWTGNRGRMKAQSDVTWSGKRFGLQNLKYELDGEAGDAELAVRLGALPAVDLKLNSQSLNLDNYVSGKAMQLSSSAALLPFLQSDGSFEKRLKFQSARLHFNQVEVQNVALEFASNVSGFEVKKFDVGSIEGAHVLGQGLVLQGPDGPSGDIKVSVNAENPRGLLRLLGFGAPAWTDVLGQTNLQGGVSIKPGAAEPLITFDAAGQSGTLLVSTSGEVKQVAKGIDSTIGVSTEITSNTSGDLLRLFGLKSTVSGNAGKLILTASGSNSTGFQTVLDASLFGTKINFDGRYQALQALPQFDGKFSVVAEDGALMGQAIGLPIPAALAGPIRIDATVVPKDNGFAIALGTAHVAGEDISGELRLSGGGHFSADLALPSLNLKNVLLTSFMPWSDKLVSMETAFSDHVGFAKSGEIWFRPSALQTGLGDDLSEAVLGLAFDAEGRSISVASRGADGEPFKLELAVKPKGSTFEVSGSGHFALDLQKNFKLRDDKSIASGVTIFDGRISGEGRSPQATLSTLNGEGSYMMRDAALTLVSPQNFFSRLKDIKDAGQLKSAFDVLLQGPGMALNAAPHKINVSSGTVIVEPLVVDTAEALVRFAPNYDLHTADVVADVTITPKSDASLPAMRITYAGQANLLDQRSDTLALSAKLGYAIIAKDLTELDRVQKEQAKLVANEEAQRRLDEEKFAAFQAQRGELRLRQRELRVHAAQRLIDAAKLKTEWDKILAAGAAINKTEMAKFKRQLQLH